MIDKEVVLNENNEHIAFLISNWQTQNPVVQKEFANHARILSEQIGCFQWAMKKRFTFDENSWKHLSRRFALLKAEGFDVRVNTRKARVKKLVAEVKETRIDAVFNRKNSNRAPKKKKQTE